MKYQPLLALIPLLIFSYVSSASAFINLNTKSNPDLLNFRLTEKANSTDAVESLQSFLNPDGTFKTGADRHTKLDPTGYNVSLDPILGPVAKPTVMTSQWNHMGAGVYGSVREIVIYGSNVYVGGYFIDAGDNPDADYAARWDGCQWHSIGPGIDGAVYAIELIGTDVIIGGEFTHPYTYIARWNGTQWFAFGDGTISPVYDILISDGDIYAGGGEISTGYVAEWIDNAWNILGPVLNGRVNVLAIGAGAIHAGGWFTDVNGNPEADGIIRWTNNSWQNLGSGINPGIYIGVWDMEFYDGELYVGGVFVSAGGDPDANEVVKWDGQHWTNIGAGIPGFLGLHDLAIFDGSLYVTIGAGWSNSDGIYRWDLETESWVTFQIMELGPDDPLTVLVTDGVNMYMGGFSGMFFEGQSYYSIARWGEPVLNGMVTNTSDSGDGSLRQTIACVDEGATITFNLPPESQITLTSGEIIIYKNLTIDGPGVDELTISGNLSSRIFHLQQATTLTLNNLSLIQGFYPVYGGAIWVQGNLELENVLFRDNFENGNFKHLSLDPLGSLTIAGLVTLHH